MDTNKDRYNWIKIYYRGLNKDYGSLQESEVELLAETPSHWKIGYLEKHIWSCEKIEKWISKSDNRLELVINK